mmetsp:Transcript_24333/g.35671  ORF Transcript_24333/g.35671 Transcript_24333/m.35671 type:complete len:402 (-) Transcript_24333:151-1356(-)|eukprot:CAMPEP_0185029184 /NCGR_PEP_ID=MMETSP1103-20130426/15340_1 /TAXON_ID=36769 /ORGANISM="Paraphysomonas bandaiensis, Strain Caron Lab Isolate" /LENGTH=401 /DNA_ID=CAMNT_0027563833 /DNA_START=41 /DNA_END=1246 /DNA_ORIENTATION=+
MSSDNDIDSALQQWQDNRRGASTDDVNLTIPPTASRTKKPDRNVVQDANFARASDLYVDQRDDMQDADDQPDDDSSSHNSFGQLHGHRQPSQYHQTDGESPDHSFGANVLVHLSRGNTAYKVIEPEEKYDENGNVVDAPTIVCLHGLTDCSYIWEDVAEVLSCGDAGPTARVLVFDFYGRGRSPWSGFPCTLDVHVTQLKELLDALNLSGSPVHLLGYCLGGAVATGFAVKFPHLCKSLCLIDSAGVRMKNPARYKILKRKCLGELVMIKRRSKMAESQLEYFFDTSDNTEHRSLIDKQMHMVQWQLNNTPGYMGAILSTYRYFPLSGMGDLFAVAGRRDRPVLILWGNNDNMFPLRKALATLEHSFPSAEIIAIQQCGHNPIFEKFEDVATAIADFYKHI